VDVDVFMLQAKVQKVQKNNEKCFTELDLHSTHPAMNTNLHTASVTTLYGLRVYIILFLFFLSNDIIVTINKLGKT